ncbi:MAG: aminotransferase class V-fold PLP-dependent enzyme [Myxococcota bacterium]|nr:aminotransferase class V-fold PLP-dependent enzyme [Myxococcota bacterium]
MPSSLARHWCLDPSITFLNHGSFGACPTAILDYQSALRARVERQPVQFYLRDAWSLVDEARCKVSSFVGAKAENFAFTRNATSAVNAVLKSMTFEQGDEIIVTSHGYPACKNIVDYVANRWALRVVVVELPFEGLTDAQIVDDILAQVNDRCRLALLDHVTSPTGLVMPMDRLVPALHERGVRTLIDGAHAPGMVDLNLEQLAPCWYVGNLHKWVCAPKGAAFLYARPDCQTDVYPARLSHGYQMDPEQTGRSSFHLNFDWTGTDDLTAWLTAPFAIEYLEKLVDDGWSGIRHRNHALAIQAKDLLVRALDISPPVSNDLLGHMVALPLPQAALANRPSPLYGSPLQEAILSQYGIEVPLIPWPAHPNRLIRVSAALHNSIADYEKLGAALKEVFAC